MIGIMRSMSADRVGERHSVLHPRDAALADRPHERGGPHELPRDQHVGLLLEEAERGRQHADDLVRLVVDRERAADDVVRGA